MQPHVFYWPAVGYMGLYIYFARRALKAVRGLLEDYEKVGKVAESLGWKDSISIAKLMLDTSLPRDDFPEDVKSKIGIARFFFYSTPLVFIVCWLLMALFSE